MIIDKQWEVSISMLAYLVTTFCLLIDLSSALQIPSREFNSNLAHPTIRSTSISQNGSLFMLNCKVMTAWHISLPNGYIYLYCMWNEHHVNDVALNLLLQNHGISSLEGRQVWNQSMRILKRDGFLSVCALKCRNGIPYARFNMFEGTQILEPKAVNLGCHDWQNLKCKDSCPDDISEVPNGNIICTDGSFSGSTCKLACHAKYKAVGADEKLCNPVTRKWQPRGPFSCKAAKIQACNRLAPVLNGRLQCSKGNQLLSRCTLKCNSGFFHIGSMIQWCLPDANSHMVWYYSPNNLTKKKTTTTGARVQCKSVKIISGTKPNSSIQYQLNTSPEVGSEDKENKRGDVFNATTEVKRLEICGVAPENRVDCGFIYRDSCLSNSCCWDSTQMDVPWCFKRSANPANQAAKQSSNTKPATTNNQSKSSNFYSSLSSPSGGSNNFAFRPHPLRSSIKCGCSTEEVPRCQTGTRRVFCGQSAQASDFPWNALLYLGNQICGGTLIAEEYILTAGHCIPNFQGSVKNLRNNYVFLGLTNTAKPGNTTQTRSMISYTKHPNFTETNRGHATNDIAIIKLNRRARISDSVKTLCLPGNKHAQTNDQCFIMGFGKTNASSRAAKVFQAAKVPLITVLACLNFYPSYLVSEQNICAGSGQPNTPDTCKGDSGGSLACKRGTDDCPWFLAGITSFGFSPCGRAAPSVYVNVYHYQEWIYSTIGSMMHGRPGG